jgi:tetratricopeptide (TPR) repeat protein
VGNYEQALLDATRALQLAPRWTKAWLRLASAYEGLGDFIRADAVLTAARQQCDAAAASLIDAAAQQLDAAKRQQRQVRSTGEHRPAGVGMARAVESAHLIQGAEDSIRLFVCVGGVIFLK